MEPDTPFEQELIPEVSVEDVKAHVKANTVSVRDGRKCVDGRYGKDMDTGMIARPGGDFGYVLTLLALNRKHNLGLTPEQCFDRVYDTVTKNSGLFYMHTDEHSEHDKEHDKGHEHLHIGCGHVAKSSDAHLCAMYDVSAEDVQRVLAYVHEKQKSNSQIHNTVLAGAHAEEGVLVVTGTEKTVDPRDTRMFFVYDKTRDNQYMETVLFPALSLNGITLEDFKAASDVQLNATLKLLAEGKPLFEVNADKEEPFVQKAGNVPSNTK